jgi:phosphatidylinositol-3-phosphatase
MRRIAPVLAVLGCLLFSAATSSAAALPPIKHVWIIMLENQDYSTSFGSASKAPYLAKTLPAQGQLLTHYYGTGHESLDNYITMVSGQPPNPYTQADAPLYVDFVGSVGSDGVAVGQGSVFPASVKTIADQLEAKKLSWKGYMEDMANSATEPKSCRHPAVGSPDSTQKARNGDQYAARHNPFVYFHSIIDRPICATNDVDLKALPGDLASAAKTPSYSFITPNLCDDGHDSPCVDGRPGGLVSANDFLKTWVPRITGSPAYADGGLLMVTFDESASGAEDCCGEPMGPNTPNNGGPTPGNGGGRVGAVLLSRYIKPGTVNDTPYNHYSMLRSMEDIFGLSHLAYAANTGLKPFQEDVFNNPSGKTGGGNTGGGGTNGGAGQLPKITLRGVPKHCVSRAFTARIGIRSKTLPTVVVRRDSKLLAKRRTRKLHLRVRIDGLREGKHALSVRASAGRSRSKTAPFRVCGGS